jgi:hypothetical protein
MNKVIQEDILKHLGAIRQYISEAKAFISMVENRTSMLEDFLYDVERYEKLCATFIEVKDQEK